MLIVADKHIPYLLPRLQCFGEVQLLEPEQITRQTVEKADALIVRTRTRCDASLLSGSNIRFIGTATIGYDHIDTTYCNRHNIVWTNAPGCNAAGVCQYVVNAVCEYENSGLRISKSDKSTTIGIIGVGHVGKLVAQYYKEQGCRVLVNDPPVEQQQGSDYLSSFGKVVTLEELASEADIITVHTPLTNSGDYPTHYLINERLLSLTKQEALIINAARGGIVDEKALLKSGIAFVLDCWENEPKLDVEVLQRSFLGTYHIAGYTKQGKQNATDMILFALGQFASGKQVDLSPVEKTINQHLSSYEPFDIKSISEQLKCSPKDFEKLRKAYVLR